MSDRYRVIVVGMDVNYAIIPVRPAGGAWSSVRDVLRYVSMELARGVLPDGSRYINEEPLLIRRAPQVPIGKDERYGMGLEVDSTWGIPVVHHGGSMGSGDSRGLRSSPGCAVRSP